MGYTKERVKVVFNTLTPCGVCHKIKADNSTETPIACLWEGGGTKGKPTQRANAKRIVRCWNNYDGLVEMCKTLKFHIEAQGKEKYTAEIYINLKQILAKTEEE